MDYGETISYIELFPRTAADPKLLRMRELMHRLGDPQDGLRFVHIAGTNGKGSVAAMLDSCLRAEGYRTGLYTSPHLLRYNERIRVDSNVISDEDLIRLTARVHEAEQSMTDKPGTFEKLTAVAFLYFAEKCCDIVVLEVGLGGEFDSTNIIASPLVSVITTVDFDHMAILGDTIPQIASAKAGIIKPGRPVAVLEQTEESLDVFRRVSASCGCEMHVASRSYLTQTGLSLDGQEMTDPDGHIYHVPFAGSYQIENISLVLLTVRLLKSQGCPVSDRAVYEGLESVSWPARFEILSRRPVFILDGAHNRHGIGGAVSSLKRLFPDKRVIYVTGMLKDKDVDSMLNILCENALSFCTLTPASVRSMEADELTIKIRQRGFDSRSFSDVGEAVAYAADIAGEDGIVCALGSLYLAGEVRSLFLT